MRFLIEIADDWLDVLDTLIELVAAEKDSSLETSLEKAIFTQINEQRKDMNYD